MKGFGCNVSAAVVMVDSGVDCSVVAPDVFGFVMEIVSLIEVINRGESLLGVVVVFG